MRQRTWFPAASRHIDQRVYDLYDEYCHGYIDRREFLARARALVIGGISALAMAQALFPRYAEAQTISFTDARIKAQLCGLPLAGWQLRKDARLSGAARGQRAVPGGAGGPREPRPQSLCRRRGAAAVPPRVFWRWRRMDSPPSAAIPGNDDDGRTLQSRLDQAKLRQDLVNSARFVKAHALSTGKLGATGFCFGGGMRQLPGGDAGRGSGSRRAVLRRGARRWRTCRRSRRRCWCSTPPPTSASTRSGRPTRPR